MAPRLAPILASVCLAFVGGSLGNSCDWTLSGEEGSSGEGFNTTTAPAPATHIPSLLLRTVERVQPGASLAYFDRHHGAKLLAYPLVIDRFLGKDYNPDDWSRDALRSECGTVEMISSDKKKIKRRNPRLVGKAWGGLTQANITGMKIDTVGEFLDLQDSDINLYLHDSSLKSTCPPWFQRSLVPKYFATDYKMLRRVLAHKSWESAVKSTHFPDIIVGKAGTGTAMHMDGWMTRFWVLQHSGRKLWRIAPPSELRRLYPINNPKKYIDSVFHVDLVDPDFVSHPLLDGALIYEAVTGPGDMLFIPEGWAHQVLNLDDSIAVSYNLADEENKDEYLNDMKHKDMAKLGRLSNETLQAIEDCDAFFLPLDPPEEAEAAEVGITWQQFFKHHDLSTAPVSRAARQYVEHYKGMLNEITSPLGASPLHTATYFRYTALVRYLVEEGAVDVRKADGRGRTALAIARERDDNKQLVDFLCGVLQASGGDECGPVASSIA